ncbi:MAG: hypothetical protein KDK36_13675 [Leptospiraceae bacterium]|nr:hypothetical protein [Leptospiraceae bacterium]
MKKIISILVLLFSFHLFSQEGSDNTSNSELKAKAHDPLQGKNLDETEKQLNAKITKWNENLRIHSKVLVAKIKLLPRNTVLYKGKLDGEECISHKKDEKTEEMVLVDQEDPENNCVKLEIFDFVKGKPKRPAFGPKTKYMVIGFDDDPSKEKNPRLASPRNVKFIRTSVLVDNLYGNDRYLVEVVDENPMSGSPDDSIYVASQMDYKPEDYKKENPSDLANGKYKLSQMKNDKTNPIRNKFKQEAYIKNLQFYHELFTKIFEFNDKNNDNKMKKNTDFIKKSFNY